MYILDTDLFSLTDRTNSHESHRLRFRLSNLADSELATTNGVQLSQRQHFGF